MEKTVLKPSRAGWREDEIDRLWEEIRRANENGQPLRSVFEEMGDQLGRKPNSVRNYYYMRLRAQDHGAMRRAEPFAVFTEEEVRLLVRSVLKARGAGRSVRAAVMELADGDHALMLRYQNKYRSVIKKRPELVEEIVREMKNEGIPCFNPLQNALVSADELHTQITERVQALGDPDILKMLSGIDALLLRAQDSDPKAHGDRLRVQLDIALMRYENLARAAGDMLLMCKEYLGQEEDVRTAVMPAFVSTLSHHISAVENAMQ
ncbi:MAG: hypothetical protein IKW00_08980 [Clostridia bacterium]|nr:hypothetical protein [Clostridia bacterium]